jgi:hypothetical protein
MLRLCHNATNYAKAKSSDDDNDADTANINPQRSSLRRALKQQIM